jgi:hypothetical protein
MDPRVSICTFYFPSQVSVYKKKEGSGIKIKGRKLSLINHMDHAIVNQHIRRDHHGTIDKFPRTVCSNVNLPPGLHHMAEAVLQDGRVADGVVGVVVVIVLEGRAVAVAGRVGARGYVEGGDGSVVEGKDGHVLGRVLDLCTPI